MLISIPGNFDEVELYVCKLKCPFSKLNVSKMCNHSFKPFRMKMKSHMGFGFTSYQYKEVIRLASETFVGQWNYRWFFLVFNTEISKFQNKEAGLFHNVINQGKAIFKKS